MPLPEWAEGQLRTRMAHGRFTVLMYHEVLPDNIPVEAWTVVRKSDFHRQMEYLGRNFRVVSLEDALMSSDNREGSTKTQAVVTFDDGYHGNREVAFPIMKALGIPMTVFVATKMVLEQSPYWYNRLILALQSVLPHVLELDLGQRKRERFDFRKSTRGEARWTEIEHLLTDLKALAPKERARVVESILSDVGMPSAAEKDILSPLTVPDVQEMASDDLVSFGAHSHCHNSLIQLEAEEIRSSVRMSREFLESWTGRRVTSFAYPNGDVNDRVISTLREEGFSCGLTTKPGLWSGTDSPFRIPRFGIGRYDSFTAFRSCLRGVAA